MNSVTSRHRYDLLVPGAVVVLAALAVFDHLHFALTHDAVSGRDWHLHLAYAFKVHYCGFDWSKIRTLYRVSEYSTGHRPPLVYLLSSLWMTGDRIDPLAAVYAAKAIWIVVLVGAVYGAGARLGGSRFAGLMAVALGAMNATVLGQARDVNVEFPMMAAVALCIWGVVRTSDFLRPGASVLAGALFGIALLTKPNTTFFVAPYLLLAFLVPERKTAVFAWNRVLNGAAANAAALAVAALFYLSVWSAVLREGKGELRTARAILESHLAYYVHGYGYLFASPLVAVLVVAALVILIVRRDRWLAPMIASGATAAVLILPMKSPTFTYLYSFQVLFALLVARALRHIPARAAAGAAIGVAALYIWPVLFSSATPLPRPGTPDAKTTPVVLRAIYPTELDSRTLRIYPACGTNIEWENVWTAGRLLSTRYAAFDEREIGIADEGDGSWAIEVALAVSRPESAWLRSLPFRNTVPFGENAALPANWIRPALRRPLVIELEPVAPRPKWLATAPLYADWIAGLRRTHRLDFEWTPTTARYYDARMRFFVRPDREASVIRAVAGPEPVAEEVAP